MKKEFIVNRQGKDFVLYAGLLDQAHSEGLKRISTKLLQSPSDENGHVAICWAEVETEKGIFSGIGDAAAENVGRMIAPHTIRMAETRAKARALRDAVNVGVSAFEELGDVDGEDSPAPRLASPSAAQPARAQRPPAPSRPQTGPQAAQRRQAVAQGNGATPAQLTRIHKLFAALGRPSSITEDLTSEAAGTLIVELVGAFNAQARSQRRPERADQQPTPADEDPFPEAAREPATQRQLDGIGQILTLLRAFHGKDLSQGPIHSKAHAKQRIDVLTQLLRAPVPEPGLPASDEARELVLSAAADLLHAGGSAESVPAELTRGGAWVLYQRLREDLKKLTGELK